jgi:hypothetical protein
MSDKGREADDLAVFDCAYMIGRILHNLNVNNKAGMETVQEAKDFIKLLRSHDWVHLDDVVEGKDLDCPRMNVCGEASGPQCPTGWPKGGKCAILNAKVRDLIGRE